MNIKTEKKIFLWGVSIVLISLMGACASSQSKPDTEDPKSICLRGFHKDSNENANLFGYLQKAIEENDATAVKKLIDGESFLCPSGFSFSNIRRDSFDDGEQVRKIMGAAVDVSSEPSKEQCRDEIILALNKAGIPLETWELSHLGQLGCKASFIPIFKELPDTRKVETMKTFVTHAGQLNQQIRQAVSAGMAIGSQLKSGYVLGYLYGVMESSCQNGGNNDKFCALKQTMENAKHDFEQTELFIKQNTEYHQKPEYLVDLICTKEAQIHEHEIVIERENEIGKTSGAVNLVTLHDQGERISDLRQEQKEFISAYERKTGKKIDVKTQCHQD